MTIHEPTTRTRRSMCPLDCPDACSLEVSVEDGRVTKLAATNANPLTEGYLCSKVRGFDQHLYHETRLQHPLVRTGKKGEAAFRRASWDEALDLVAERMRAAREKHGGEAILPLAYGGSNGMLTDGSTDELLFGRLGASFLLRTVCAAPTKLAQVHLYGSMQGVAFEDYARAELIVVWGTNPHATGIHLVPNIQRAQAAGAKLVVVDPVRTALARRADLHVQLRPGTDLPVALALHRFLFENGAADQTFLAEHTTGAGVLRLRAEPWTLERAAGEAEIEVEVLRRFAGLYAVSDPAVIRCGWGIERSRCGGSAVCAVIALPAVAGKFGVRGGGYTLSNGGAWNLRPAAPPQTGWGRAINMNLVGRELLERDDPPIDVVFVYNANPVATLPNQERVIAGFSREDLFTVVFDQVMTDTARFADVVLPATTFLEHAELRKSYGSVALQYAEPVIDPVGESRPNYAVFADLARRLGVWREGDREEPEELVDAILAGQDDARAALRANGLALPRQGASVVQFVDVHPQTPNGKVNLHPPELERQAPRGLYTYLEDPATPEHPLALISPATARTVSSTFGQLHTEEVAVQLHSDDAAARGIAGGDPVRVFNHYGEVHTHAEVSEHLRPGVALLPKGLWSHNTRNGRTANALAPDTLSDVGAGACFNDARVEVERL